MIDIKIQPIESASKEYAHQIVDGLIAMLNTNDPEGLYEANEEYYTNIARYFSDGAKWVLQLLEFRLQHSVDLKPLYELTKTLMDV